MKKNKLQNLIIIIFYLILPIKLNAEIIILSSCNNEKDGFLKNEYILDLNQYLMTRNYIYNNKTFEKYRVTDLSVKKQNKIQRLIYKEENKILTEKLGYPQFYTQLVFDVERPIIEIKTVINNEEGVDILSTCKKIEKFEKES
jgi:hypothetical protein|tara:strand:- start:254 stop:682 length:429 start_codon:yes stop_codon:yes gene_type:complete